MLTVLHKEKNDMTLTHDRPAIEAFVRAEFQGFGVESDRMTPEATLEDLGLDSLDVVELSQAAQRKLGIDVHPDNFSEAKTFDEAVGVIYRHVGN